MAGSFEVPLPTILEVELHVLGMALCILAYLFGALKLSFVYILLMLVLALMYGETRYMFFSDVYDKYVTDISSKETMEREWESTYWLNTIMRKSWSCICKDFQKIVRGNVNKAMFANKPGFMTSLRISKLKLPDPPLITFMQGYKPPKRENHEIKCDVGILVYFPNALIQVTVVIFKIPLVFAVKELMFEGTARLEADLLSPPNFIEAVRFSFLQTPSMDFSFVIIRIFDVMNVPFLNSWITGLIERAMTDLLVSPNVFELNVAELLDPAYNGAGMLCDGVLLVTVKRVENLPRDLFGISKSCIRISYGRQIKKSSYAKNVANAEMNDKLWFYIFNPNSVTLIISVLNQNASGKEKEIKKKDLVLEKLGQADDEDSEGYYQGNLNDSAKSGSGDGMPGSNGAGDDSVSEAKAHSSAGSGAKSLKKVAKAEKKAQAEGSGSGGPKKEKKGDAATASAAKDPSERNVPAAPEVDGKDIGSMIGKGDPKEVVICIEEVKVYLDIRYVVIPIENEDLMVDDNDPVTTKNSENLQQGPMFPAKEAAAAAAAADTTRTKDQNTADILNQKKGASDKKAAIASGSTDHSEIMNQYKDSLQGSQESDSLLTNIIRRDSGMKIASLMSQGIKNDQLQVAEDSSSEIRDNNDDDEDGDEDDLESIRTMSTERSRKSKIVMDKDELVSKQRQALQEIFQEDDLCGLLRLNIIEARGLSYKSGAASYGTYAELYVDQEKCSRTAEVLSTDPQFKQTIEGVVTNMQSALVEIKLFTLYQKVSPALLGTLSFQLIDLIRDTYNIQNKWYRLNGDGSSGEIKLSIVYIPMDLRIGAQARKMPIQANGVRRLLGKQHVYDCDLLMLTVHEANWRKVLEEEDAGDGIGSGSAGHYQDKSATAGAASASSSARKSGEEGIKLSSLIRFMVQEDAICETSVKRNIIHPVWNEKFRVPILNRDMRLKFVVKSQSFAPPGEVEIGEGELDFDGLLIEQVSRPNFLQFSGWVPFIGEELCGQVRISVVVVPKEILPDRSSIYTLKQEKNILFKALDLLEASVGTVGTTALAAGSAVIKGLTAGKLNLARKSQISKVPNADELQRLGKYGGFVMSITGVEGLPDRYMLQLIVKINGRKVIQTEDIKCQARGIISFPSTYFANGLSMAANESEMSFAIRNSKITLKKSKEYNASESFGISDIFTADETAKEDPLLRNVLNKSVPLTFEVAKKKVTFTIKIMVTFYFVAQKERPAPNGNTGCSLSVSIDGVSKHSDEISSHVD